LWDIFRIPIESYGQTAGFQFAGHERDKTFKSGTNAKLITKRGLHVPYIDITGLKVFFTVTICLEELEARVTRS
jgi:hypothetical protein